MDKEFPFKEGDIQEFFVNGERTKRTIEKVDVHSSGCLVVSSTSVFVPKEYVFQEPKEETIETVQEDRKKWFDKVKGWFNG